MISHVTKLSCMAVIVSHDALNRPSPHCSHAAEISHFQLIHIHSKAGFYIFQELAHETI